MKQQEISLPISFVHIYKCPLGIYHHHHHLKFKMYTHIYIYTGINTNEVCTPNN